MAGFNKVILMGNLTRDPQLRYLPNNTAVCDFGLAVSRRWRDRDGNQKDDVCFVDLTAWARSAEVINQYMRKGSLILVEGRLKLDTWTGQDGQKRSKHTVVVENFQFAGGREGGGAPAGGPTGTGQSAGGPPSRGPGPGPESMPPDSGMPDYGPPPGEPPTTENIPF
jgi:single-strand DNA-binding protein